MFTRHKRCVPFQSQEEDHECIYKEHTYLVWHISPYPFKKELLAALWLCLSQSRTFSPAPIHIRPVHKRTMFPLCSSRSPTPYLKAFCNTDPFTQVISASQFHILPPPGLWGPWPSATEGPFCSHWSCCIWRCHSGESPYFSFWYKMQITMPP